MDKDETSPQLPDAPVLCKNNCGFFGSSTTMNLCSMCYREVVMKQAKAVEASPITSSVISSAPVVHQEISTGNVPGPSSQDAEPETTSTSSMPANVPPKQPNRCFTCNKRVGLTGFKCRCGNQFCSLHRYHDKHNCPFDYHAAARDAIAKANPIVKADKVDKI